MKSIRETFLPDEGCLLVRCDLAQVEHRMGLMYTKAPHLMQYASVSPADYDAFTEGAKDIFGVQKVTKEMRYLTKKVFHASWRGMRGDKMSESVSKDTDGKLFKSAKECQRLLDIHLSKMPEIESVYMPWCRKQVRDYGVLVNSWGRRLRVTKRQRDIVDDDTYRIAYSYYLQSEAADWTNQYGFIPGSYYMLARYGRPLNAQIHDEIIASVPIEGAYDFSRFIVDSMERSREIPAGSGNYVTIPAEITVGRSWGDRESVEFKRLPREGEFYDKISSFVNSSK